MYNSQIKYEMKSDQSPSFVREDQFDSSFSYSINDVIEIDSNDESDFDYESLITEDDTPVDNLFSERQQRLLAESLYTDWDTSRIFMACANVGIYPVRSRTPIVPDMFLSMDVKLADDIWAKKNRCYMVQVFGKPPELVVELVSNTVGNERTTKFQQYEAMGVKYYVIFDPDNRIFKTRLHAYELKQERYVAFHWQSIQKNGVWFSDLGLGLKIQPDIYQQYEDDFLVWYDHTGKQFLSGEQKAKAACEYAEAEKARAEAAEFRAEAAEFRADAEKKRADAAFQEIELLKAQLENMRS